MFKLRSVDYEKYKYLRGSIYTLEGIIGVGKTTLGKSLEKFFNEIGLNCKFYPEYVNIELLNQYIHDMKKYGYTFQMIMLIKRIEIYKEAEMFSQSGGIAIIDRSIIGDKTFAKMQKDNGNISDDEWITYNNLMLKEIQLTPTACIFLNCTPEKSLERVKTRGYDAEIKGYTLEYMTQLYNAYKTSMDECNYVKYFYIEWNNDFVLIDDYLSKNDIYNILNKIID